MRVRAALCDARLWPRFGTICGGKWNSCTGSKRCNRRLIERERSDHCKPSWQPPSENFSDFVLRHLFRRQDLEASKNIARGEFTRCAGSASHCIGQNGRVIVERAFNWPVSQSFMMQLQRQTTCLIHAVKIILYVMSKI